MELIMDKAIPIFDLEKIPDSQMIKLLRIEIGKLTSEIDELKYLLSKHDNGEHKQSNNSIYIKDMEGQLRNLKKKYESFDAFKIIEAKNEEINDLNKTIVSQNIEIAKLKFELFNLLKKNYETEETKV